MRVLESVLALYTWAMMLVLLVAMLMIARFFEIKSGERTHYQLFVAPVVFFLVAGIRYAFFSNVNWVGDIANNILFLCGGVVALIVGNRLLKSMTGDRQ